MAIAHPKLHFRVPNKIHGIAMQAYYGGRAECRIRKTPVPVILTDFTSQYPTVNALLGNWSVLTAQDVRFRPCTGSARKFLAKVNLKTAFKPAFWKDLSFFALVKPDNDILPVRTVYNSRTRNIGLNYLTSRRPIWYAGPDIVASTLLTGEAPQIMKAVRMEASRQQKKLSSTYLAGTVSIDPKREDFFVNVIEQRSRLKRSNPPVSNFLKVVGNAGSYGLFVQVDPDTLQKARRVTVYSGTKRLTQGSRYIEKTGPWYFPPIASLITSGGRLLLAMLERCITDAGGSYLFCDTDSMCIVGSMHGGQVSCIGGKRKHDGNETIKALSLRQVKAIVHRFNRLNPYDRNCVPSLLKIEDINFTDSDAGKPLRQLFGYAIAAKRYALYDKTGNDASIVKASGHGLGYLFAPKKNESDQESDNEANDEAPLWVFEAWDWLIRRELGLKGKAPTWINLPAMMRMTMTSPNVMRHNRPDWLAPYNFFLFPIISDFGGFSPGLNRGNCNLIVPFESNRKKWKSLRGINLWDGQVYRLATRHSGTRDTVVPESFRIILAQYLRHPEVKSLAPDGTVCVGSTLGLLRRASIHAVEIVLIGKETDRSLGARSRSQHVGFQAEGVREEISFVRCGNGRSQEMEAIGVRELMRKSRLSQKAVYSILNGQSVRRSTLETFKRSANG